MTAWANWKMLAFLLALWAGVLAFQIASGPVQRTVPLTFTSGRAASEKTVATSPATRHQVRIAPAKVRAPRHRPGKNIFAPLDYESSVVAAQTSRSRPVTTPTELHREPAPTILTPVIAPTPPPPPSAQELAAQLARQQEEAARTQALQQMAQFRFLGYFQENGNGRAFLGRGPDIFILTHGELLDGKFIVTALDSSSVTLHEPRTGTETTIGLAATP